MAAAWLLALDFALAAVYFTLSSRLGIWGPGSPFRDFNDFLGAVEKREVGAMEIVAMDMKLRGMYIARYPYLQSRMNYCLSWFWLLTCFHCQAT